jgi:AcrR family transcriptional regulator
MPSRKNKAPARTNKAPTRRGRGRPGTKEKSLLDRRVILDCAFDMARSVPLQDLSIVKVAKELSVTPALIHYYLEGRDALTSGIMNAFYREAMQRWPASGGDWRRDLEAVCRKLYQAHVSYPGVAAYVVGHSRFRMAQVVEPGEEDYGTLLFERFVGAVRAGGFDAERTATYAHLLMEFLTSAAHTTVRHRWPGEHASFLDQLIGSLDPARFPNAHFVRRSYVRFDAGIAFEEALALFLNALDVERQRSV